MICESANLMKLLLKQQVFYKLNANNIIIAILISVISASVILTMALLRFRKKDIC
jgi:hypothetical protein